jgi:hypothetical protein
VGSAGTSPTDGASTGRTVSYNAQREIEKVVRNALANGRLENGDTLTTAVTLANDKVDLNITIFSKIEL